MQHKVAAVVTHVAIFTQHLQYKVVTVPTHLAVPTADSIEYIKWWQYLSMHVAVPTGTKQQYKHTIYKAVPVNAGVK